jgi:hypothetical protein
MCQAMSEILSEKGFGESVDFWIVLFLFGGNTG